MEALITKIGGWLAAIMWAAFGSGFSIFIDRKDIMILNKFVIFFTFVFGMIIGYVGGGFINEYFNVAKDSFAAFASQFICGYMGIAALVEVKDQIKLAITAIRKKYLGE